MERFSEVAYMKKLLAILCMSTCLCGMSVTSFAAESEAVEAISEEVVTDTSEATEAATLDTSGTSEDILSSEAYLNYGSTFDGLVQELRNYTDEELNTMLSTSTNEADVQLLESWMAIKDEIGAYIGVLSCEAVEGEADLTVTMKFDFTEKDITMNYTATAEAVTIGFETELTTMEILKKAGLNTVIGMGTTFAILFFISILISTFSFIPKLFGKKEVKKAEPVKEKTAELPVEAVEEDLTDDLELVAVITAAIAATEGTSADGVVIRSIKRADNAKWKKA